MIDKAYKYFMNIQGSPKTTYVGALLMVLSASMYFFQLFTNDTSATTTSIEALVGFIGLWFLFKEDHDKGNQNNND